MWVVAIRVVDAIGQVFERYAVFEEYGEAAREYKQQLARGIEVHIWDLMGQRTKKKR